MHLGMHPAIGQYAFLGADDADITADGSRQLHIRQFRQFTLNTVVGLGTFTLLQDVVDVDVHYALGGQYTGEKADSQAAKVASALIGYAGVR